MNKEQLQNILFNVKHLNISIDDATKFILDNASIINNHLKQEPKKEVWELYPDYRSCIEDAKKGYCVYTYGEIVDTEYRNYTSHICHTKSLAKRQLAELQLAKIADKWGEGIEYEDYIYFPVISLNGNIISNAIRNDGIIEKLLPFHFKTEEQCKKSIELHPQLWKDWFMID
jgi:hypothetical protein